MTSDLRSVAHISANIVISKAEGAHLVGRRAGRVVPDAVLRRLEPSLLRDRVVISRNADRFLQGKAATGIFRVYKDGSATIFLRSSPTHYEVMHELIHYEHFKKIGARLFSKLSFLEREQYVYDGLRNKYGKSLSQAEQHHAMTYIRNLGGKK